jgi:glycine cleavage system H protein
MAELKIPGDLKYTESDEWIRVEGNIVTIGLTDFAQNALNDIVYVELPDEGDALEKGETFGSVESVKAASDRYSPVSGTAISSNEALEDEPELINADPYGTGWLIKVELAGDADFADLMDAAAYQKFCEGR